MKSHWNDFCIPTKCKEDDLYIEDDKIYRTRINCFPYSFPSIQEDGPIYYQLALFCGPDYLPEFKEAFFTFPSFLLALFYLEVSRVMSGNKEEKTLDRSLEKLIKQIQYLNYLVQILSSSCSCILYFMTIWNHLNYYEIQCSVDLVYCRFMLWSSLFLYKSFTVPFLQVYATFMESSHFDDLDVFLSTMVIFLFLMPFVIYSIGLLIIFFPVFLVLIPILLGSFYLMIFNNTLSDYINKRAPKKLGKLEEKESKHVLSIVALLLQLFLYFSLILSKGYLGCSWKYTTVSLFDHLIDFDSFRLGFSWPRHVNLPSQYTLTISLGMGLLSFFITLFILLFSFCVNIRSIFSNSRCCSSLSNCFMSLDPFKDTKSPVQINPV